MCGENPKGDRSGGRLKYWLKSFKFIKTGNCQFKKFNEPQQNHPKAHHKLLKSSTKKKYLKAARVKRHIMQRGRTIRLMGHFSSEK